MVHRCERVPYAKVEIVTSSASFSSHAGVYVKLASGIGKISK